MTNAADERRVQNLVDRLERASEFGAKTVEAALKNGAEVVLSDGLGKAEGGVIPAGENGGAKIVLNAAMPDARLMTALVRLSRTARQTENVSAQMPVRDAVMTARAKTADAVAHEAAAAYEMRLTEPEAYQAFFNKNMKVAGCYFYTRHESGNVAKAMNRAVEAWYDCPEKVAAVDESVITHMAAAAEKGASPAMNPERLAKIFTHDGTPYVSAAFLKSEKACFLSDNQKDRIGNIEKFRRPSNLTNAVKASLNARFER